MNRFLLRLCVLLLAALPGAVRAGTADSLRVLFIGNSYTYYNDLPSMVRQIASTQRMKLSCTRVVKGGERLSGHLKNERLLELLARGGWDYVVIQEQSTAPARPTGQVMRETYPAARALDSLAHAGSPDVRVIYYMTWGHKYGSVYPTHGYRLIENYEGMQERLITSYLEMTYANGGWCAPVGMAWRRVRHERPDCLLYCQDCFHPSAAGSYLAANVLFATIAQRPYQTDFTAGLPPEEAEYLQRTAQRTVLENRVLLNLP